MSTTTRAADAFVLTTERLAFRSWRLEDEELALALWGDPEVARHIFKEPPSRDTILERLAREMTSQREHGVQYWPIFLRANGDHVGCCGLRSYAPEDDVYELGVHIRPAHWRKGFAFEAASAAIAHAFERTNVKALFAGHNPANDASRQMLLKLGFAYTHDELYPPTGLLHPSYRLTRTRSK